MVNTCIYVLKGLHINVDQCVKQKDSLFLDLTTLKTPPLHYNCLKRCQVMTCLRCGVDSTFYLEVRLPVLSTPQRKQVTT